jgi:hypothetical protein
MEDIKNKIEMRADNQKLVTFALLDYNRPAESELCIKSIKEYCRFSHDIVYFSNGGNQNHAVKFYSDGLIDKLILKKENNGCGFGTYDLYSAVTTPYTIYVQVDQFLAREFYWEELMTLIESIEEEGGVLTIALAGDQGRGRYSERANICKTEFYLDFMKNCIGGGPGPFQEYKYTEQEFQERMEANPEKASYKVYANQLFGDNGVFSIRELDNGDITRHRCDTKVLQFLKGPKVKHEWPELTNEEWDEALAGNWPKEGKIPANWLQHSFLAWNC